MPGVRELHRSGFVMLTDDDIRRALVRALYAVGHPTPDLTVDLLIPVVEDILFLLRRDTAQDILRINIEGLTAEDVLTIAAALVVAPSV